MIRYDSNKGPMDRFLKFIPIFADVKAEIDEIILQFLDEHGFKIEDCCGQSCHNAAKMNGKCRSLETLICEKC